jgi:hypothetical protein
MRLSGREDATKRAAVLFFVACCAHPALNLAVMRF